MSQNKTCVGKRRMWKHFKKKCHINDEPSVPSSSPQAAIKHGMKYIPKNNVNSLMILKLIFLKKVMLIGKCRYRFAAEFSLADNCLLI